MTIGQLIEELLKFPQDMPVCGESEKGTWDILPEHLEVFKDVDGRPTAMILGYVHLNYEKAS